MNLSYFIPQKVTKHNKPFLSFFKTSFLQFRFLLPLIIVMSVATYVALPWIDNLTLKWFMRDSNSRGDLLVNVLSGTIENAIEQHELASITPLFERIIRDKRLYAIGLCSPEGQLLSHTTSFPENVSCARMLTISNSASPQFNISSKAVVVSSHALPSTQTNADATATPAATQLIFIHNLTSLQQRSQEIQRYFADFIVMLGTIIAIMIVLTAHLSWRDWLRNVRKAIHGKRSHSVPLPPFPLELADFSEDLKARMRDLEDQYRRAKFSDVGWNAERLRSLLNTQLSGDQVIVVSNREPYIHDRNADGIFVKRPASGLVTAVEPVMRACSGTWIAHGSGNADREVVDANDKVAVPPGRQDYTLRRIWMSEEEERGYYYGFANEGMWPLCHVAHVRPIFRESDWQAYKNINQRFADAVVAEARSEDPIVLVQDYHFALLPAMVREKLPQATILTFWHIPWPNPESFGICPWRKEILQGMLGSTILGFHTRFHCKNFMETVDRYLEARIGYEHSKISFNNKETFVESYPISIEWPAFETEAHWNSIEQCRRNVVERLQLPADTYLAVGVDRFDYTKGILERLNAVERLLEKHPELVGKFVLVQIAAPTRSALDEYRNFQERIERRTNTINKRFGSEGYAPIQLLAEHHEPDALIELYRAADMCIVTSLHDGMNLVCKEFIAARNDEKGVLILSRFAGAAHELGEALIVNPYHVEETADALYQAATMSAAEQHERMVSLRHTVRESNIFRWAGRMLSDASRWRLRDRVAARVKRFQQLSLVE